MQRSSALPKKRGAVAPKGFTRRYGNTIAARIPTVARDGLDACIYKGATSPVNKAPPTVTKQARPVPGEEYESPKALPPVENAVTELPSASNELQSEPGQPPAPEQNGVPEQPKEPSNGVLANAPNGSRSALRERNGASPLSVE